MNTTFPVVVFQRLQLTLVTNSYCLWGASWRRLGFIGPPLIGCWCGIDLARVGFRPSRLIVALQQRESAQVKSCQIMLVTVVKDEKIKVVFKLKGSGSPVYILLKSRWELLLTSFALAR